LNFDHEDFSTAINKDLLEHRFYPAIEDMEYTTTELRERHLYAPLRPDAQDLADEIVEEM